MQDLAGIRSAILNSLKVSIGGNSIETSVLANDEEMAQLIHMVQTQGLNGNISKGTDANGNRKFIVGISQVGGIDVVG